MDMGADTIEISVISLGGLVLSDLMHFGSNRLDESIISYIRREFNLVIGKKTAKALKEELGSGLPGRQETMTVVGLDVVSGLPVEREITAEVVYEAIKANLESICSSIKLILEKHHRNLPGILSMQVFISQAADQKSKILTSCLHRLQILK